MKTIMKRVVAIFVFVTVFICSAPLMATEYGGGGGSCAANGGWFCAETTSVCEVNVCNPSTGQSHLDYYVSNTCFASILALGWCTPVKCVGGTVNN